MIAELFGDSKQKRKKKKRSREERHSRQPQPSRDDLIVGAYSIPSSGPNSNTAGSGTIRFEEQKCEY